MSDEKPYDIEEAFKEIEDELLGSLKRRLERGITEQGITDESIEKGYQIWQAEQLKALQQYRFIEDKKFINKFSKLNKKMEEMIEETAKHEKTKTINEILKKSKGEDTRPPDADEYIVIDRNKLNNLLKSTTNDMAKAEYATLRMMDDQYRKIIFNAQVYLNTSSGSLRKAIDMATYDFYANGINSVEYKNGARVNITSYSEMALRTANRRAELQGGAEARDEYDIHLVIINNRGMMCPRCAKYRGRVCIDDVFGNGKPDGEHALLSEFMAGGLYHPNCRDSHTTYFEGLTETPKVTKKEIEESKRNYDLEQMQRYNERQIRKWKRLESNQLDEENVKKASMKRKEWQARQREFIANHQELRRKYDREKIY